MDNPSPTGLEVISMDMIIHVRGMRNVSFQVDLPCSQREEDDVVEASIVDAT